MRIAFLDDEEQCRADISACLAEYCSETMHSFKVFSSAEGLMNDLIMGEHYDLFLLDIMMPDLSGISLGKKIRETDADAFVVYLTSSRDFAIESYSVRAYNYLVKPTGKEELCQVLDSAARHIEELSRRCVLVKTKDAVVRLAYQEILYCESCARKIRYYMKSGEMIESMTFRGKFRDACGDILSDSRFAMCGAAYIFNLQHVTAVSSREACLGQTLTVAIPRGAHTKFRERWVDYWTEGKNE